jgi:hypothetical protein
MFQDTRSTAVLVRLGNVAVLTFRLVIVGQFRTLYLLFLESECRIFGGAQLLFKIQGKKPDFICGGWQAGAQHPNAKIQISFYGPSIYMQKQ